VWALTKGSMSEPLEGLRNAIRDMSHPIPCPQLPSPLILLHRRNRDWIMIRELAYFSLVCSTCRVSWSSDPIWFLNYYFTITNLLEISKHVDHQFADRVGYVWRNVRGDYKSAKISKLFSTLRKKNERFKFLKDKVI